MTERFNLLLLVAVVGLAAALFIVDLHVPLGVAVWLPYGAVVLISLWFPERWQTYTTASVCSALMTLGLFLSPMGGGPFWTAAVNRVIGMLALWITAVVGLAARRTRQLQDANRKLQREIVERERLQSQLLRSQRLESIGVLAGGIAHDFNNLLTPILMSVKLLKEDRPAEERRDLLSTLQASAERGAEMVRQLLAFAGGSVEGRRSAVQPGQIIREIEAILGHTFPKGIRIRVHLADTLMLVHADATQMSQVLMNLCINARDAMPTGGSLTVRADNFLLDKYQSFVQPGARPGWYVQIEVSDTGSGIAPDYIDKVFDPFFTTKGPGKGSGLGLSTALGIVKSHGGFINVESEVGTGSRFAVFLPALADRQVSDTAQVQSVDAKGQGEMILIVDDESIILETARAALEGCGYQVVTATGGKQAIDLYRRHQRQIQAVLLDMMMPDMDGQTTMAALVALDPSVRIIASSGLPVSRQVSETLNAGQGGVLPKPYTETQLLSAITAVLGKNEREQ